MPFQPGHKEGEKRIMPGRSRQMAKHMSNFALAVRDDVPTSMMTRWHTMILEGKSPLAVVDEDGRVIDIIPEPNGFVPTLKDRNEAMGRMMAYGLGQPAQMVHVEASIRAMGGTGDQDPTRGLTPAAVAAIARIINQRLATPPVKLLEAHAIELQPLAQLEASASASADEPEPDA